jgi:hypothetical protein
MSAVLKMYNFTIQRNRINYIFSVRAFQERKFVILLYCDVTTSPPGSFVTNTELSFASVETVRDFNTISWTVSEIVNMLHCGLTSVQDILFIMSYILLKLNRHTPCFSISENTYFVFIRAVSSSATEIPLIPNIIFGMFSISAITRRNISVRKTFVIV